MKRSYAYILFPLAGMAFCLWYVCTATSDVVNSDYIRLVNSYLPDVWNPEKFFVADVLTRIPVNYLARILNVTFFDFSVRFDQILGILGLGLTGMAACAYARKEGLGFLTMTAVTLLIFSLNKWEMLTNGSGWAHFLTFAGFYYYYLVLDRVWKAEMVLGGQADRKDRIRLMVLPFISCIRFPGSAPGTGQAFPEKGDRETILESGSSQQWPSLYQISALHPDSLGPLYGKQRFYGRGACGSYGSDSDAGDPGETEIFPRLFYEIVCLYVPGRGDHGAEISFSQQTYAAYRIMGYGRISAGFVAECKIPAV